MVYCANGPDDVRCSTDYVQLLFCSALITNEIANFVKQHLVTYEYASIT